MLQIWPLSYAELGGDVDTFIYPNVISLHRCLVGPNAILDIIAIKDRDLEV